MEFDRRIQRGCRRWIEYRFYHGDGVPDYYEIEGWRIDDDGEVVLDKIDGIKTDPINPDTDFDGWFDGRIYSIIYLRRSRIYSDN